MREVAGRDRPLLLAFAATLVCAATAAAADLPLPAPPPEPVEIYNWTGIYIGANGGFVTGSNNWNTSGGGSSGTFSSSGVLGGGTIGVNYQTGQFVLGAEGDGSWADLRGTSGAPCSALGAPLDRKNTSHGCSAQSDWMATARGRAGYAINRILIYGTGGAAFASIRTGVNPANATPGAPSFNSATEIGWTAGAGIEAAFTPNWTVRVEYLFADFSHAACSTACSYRTAGTTVTPNISAALSESIVRAGINFKFGPW